MTDRSEKARPSSLVAHDHEYTTELSETPQPSDTDTATNSSDEFDWDDDEDSKSKQEMVKAKRGRALWLAFMKLSRAVRVLLVGALVAAVLVTPFIVVKLRFEGSPAGAQVRVWSIWLTITWAAACVTYLFVDSIPRVIIFVVNCLGGHVERLKLQMEVCYLFTHS